MANRRYPFDEMDSMMSRMFRNMWGDIGSELGLGYEGEGRMGRSDIHLDVESDDEGYVILADLPGFEKEEIDLRYDDGFLTIEARHEVEQGGEHVHYTRSRNAFERVRLPAADVVVEGISATYRNSVLEVHVPVEEMEDDDAHRIDID